MRNFDGQEVLFGTKSFRLNGCGSGACGEPAGCATAPDLVEALGESGLLPGKI